MKAYEIDALPKDRAFLHFESTPISDGDYQVDYELVLPLRGLDLRGTFNHKGRKARPKSHRAIWMDRDKNRRIPLGRTRVNCESRTYPFSAFGDNLIDLPFRDGAHQAWDNEKLGGLPLIYTMGEKHWELTPEGPQ